MDSSPSKPHPGALAGMRVDSDDAGYLGGLQRTRRNQRLEALVGVGLLAVGTQALGTTGSPPPGCKSGCETRPTCQSCRKMRPPLACTPDVVSFQPDLLPATRCRGSECSPYPVR